MLFQQIGRISVEVFTQWTLFSRVQFLPVSILFGTIIFWLGWRVWKFTIVPMLNPLDPRLLSYWIPCLGHTWSFSRDSHTLMRKGVTDNGGTREPFAITVAGTKYYVITSPEDAGEFYKNTSTLSWDGFLNETLATFGVASRRLDVLWRAPEVPTLINPSRKCLIHLTQDLYQQHLLPGPRFSTLISKYKATLNRLLTWKRLTSNFGLPNSSGTIQVSLYDLCASVLIDATQLTLFDPILFEIDPTMTTNMRRFTDELWKLFYPSRWVKSREVMAIRQQYTRAFLKYQSLPQSVRKEESWVVSTLIDQYKQFAIDERDSAAMLVMIYWAGDANAYKLAFWIMAYILWDKELRTSIHKEVREAFENDNLDLVYLSRNCPRLKSVYHEVLRLRKRDLAFRKVERDTQMGSKRLRAGNFALIPFCQLHENKDVFGDDCLDFSPDRFQNRPELANHQSYKPYGGGRTYCPGRFFAMQEIFGFVALLLLRFDVQLASQSKHFPMPDEFSLTLGISRPLPGSDLLVTLSQNRED